MHMLEPYLGYSPKIARTEVIFNDYGVVALHLKTFRLKTDRPIGRNSTKR